MGSKKPTHSVGRQRRLLCYAGIGMLVLIALSRAGQADVTTDHAQSSEQVVPVVDRPGGANHD